MNNSSLILLVKSMDKSQLKELNSFVRSPYFNTNKALTSLFEYIRKQHPEYAAEKLEKKFENSFWDEFVLFGLRVFPIVPTFSISLTCGLIRFNIYSYLFFTFFGTFVKVLMLAPLGWQANAFYHKYAFLISGIEKIGLFVVVVAIAVFIFRRISRNKNIAEKGKPQ